MKSQIWACYEDYLKSPEWAKIRGMALDRAGHRCQVCNSDVSLQVHHRVYDSPWGEESTSDLIALCNSCHMLFHRNESRIKKIGKLEKKLDNLKKEQARAGTSKKRKSPKKTPYARAVEMSGGIRRFSKEALDWCKANPRV